MGIIKKTYLTAIFLLANVHIYECSGSDKESSSEMIIFIHGSMQLPEWRFSDLLKVLRDQIENSIYVIATDYLRKDPFFRQGQAMQDEGLQKIDLNDTKNAASIMARICDAQYQWQGNGAKHLYYTFGWKGLVHLYTRYEEAKKLLSQLYEELESLHTQGIYPKIKIITYSHGGNVALNLAAVKDDIPEFADKPLEIDQLIMLATPIQRATDYLVASPLFKKVYHFYSHSDPIQTLDFTCPKQFFSKRTFKKRKGFDLPQSLVQIRMRVTKSLYKRYKKAKDISLEDVFLQKNVLQHSYSDPKHTEFWSFQWGSRTYKSSFALAPLPVVAFCPAIIAALESNCSSCRSIVFDYAPDYDCAFITNRGTKKALTVNMLTRLQRDALHLIAQGSGKIALDIHQQREHLRSAVEQAEDDYNQKHFVPVSRKNIMQLAMLIR